MEVHRFGAFTTFSADVGSLSVTELTGSGSFTTKNGRLEAAISAVVCYQANDNEKGFIFQGPDLYISRPELFKGNLIAQLRSYSTSDGVHYYRALGGAINLTLSDKQDGLGRVESLRIPLENLKFWTRSVLGATGNAVPIKEKRRIGLRIVGFKDNEEDNRPSGLNVWRDQIRQAQAIWNSCCVILDHGRLEEVILQDMKNSTDCDLLRANFGNDDPDAIEVVFTSGFLGNVGGYTYAPGCDYSVVVLSDQAAAANGKLLAHEIGHVLGARHPGDPNYPGLWEPSEESVLGLANLPLVNATDCALAKNPKLLPNGKKCP